MRARSLVGRSLSLFAVGLLVSACGGDSDTGLTGPSGGSAGSTGGTSNGGASGAGAGAAGGAGSAAGSAGASAGSSGSAGAAGSGTGASAGSGGSTGGASGSDAGSSGANAGGDAGASGGDAGNGSGGDTAGGSAGNAGTAGANAGSGGTNGGGSAGASSGGTGGAGGNASACDPKTCDGVCTGDVCCAAENACDSVCCAGSTVCLFGACVTPGSACQSAGDCPADSYCETALGANTGSGGASGSGGQGGGQAGGPVCSQSLPQNGRCLPKPVTCDAQGQPAGCVEVCEFKPTAGKLNAVKKWSWGADNAVLKPAYADVWSSPMVGRVLDANCDGKVDELDPPNIVFVSGNSINTTTNVGTNCNNTNTGSPTACHRGVLRVLDGRTGAELLSIDKISATSVGISGVSPAIGDVNGDGLPDIVFMTGEGDIIAIDRDGKVIGKSDKIYPNGTAGGVGWGGGLALGDMDGDGFPEIALGRTVWTTATLGQGGVITQKFVGAATSGGNATTQPLSYFADVNGDGGLELIAGPAVYKADGTLLWQTVKYPDGTNVVDGFTGIADFDKDGKPELAFVSGGKLSILDATTGKILVDRFTIPGAGNGGPPTIADFTGDGRPDVGVATQNFYSAFDIDLTKTPKVLWSVANHDLSSSVTGSSVFDFEGDGRAEVIYADECFLWVFDGQTGAVRFATPTSSFTGTESSIVADVDGDGHAELVWLANGADPSSTGWKCDVSPWNQPDDATGRPAWVPGPAVKGGYRGIAVFGDKNNSWVGTRTLWNQHAYSVTNVCDQRDSACAPNASYGTIPATMVTNWEQPWLNNFRQNVQDKGLFDAPDAIVSVAAACSNPVELTVSLRNAGPAALPAGVEVELRREAGDFLLGSVTTTAPLGGGQTVKMVFQVPNGLGGGSDRYYARIPTGQAFRECREGNNDSAHVQPPCKD